MVEFSAVPPRAQGHAIDVHSHVVPFDFPPVASGRSTHWPSMAPAGECHRSVMIDGKVYRTVSDRCWSPSKRLADFSDMGLTQQVISPMPELLSYWLEPRDAQQLLRHVNEQIAAMVAEAGSTLIGLGAVPLQSLDLAIAELTYVMEVLGFAGVEVGSNINGTPIGDRRFDAFFEACESLGAAVFVHAVRPTGMDRVVGPSPLEQVLGYPTDIGLAAASVITTNLIERRPRLRIAFSHGGGTLAALLPRLQEGWQVFTPLGNQLTASPVSQARKLFYDALVFDAATLRHLVTCFGETQLMLGTDHPFNFRDREPVVRVEGAELSAAAITRLTYANAEQFLALHSRNLS